MQKFEPPPRVKVIDVDGEGVTTTEVREWENWFRLIANHMPIINRYEQELDVTSVAANTTSEQTFTVSGLTTRDAVFVTKPSHNTGLGVVNARVSAADTLALTFMNTTAGAIDPSAETYFIVAVRM